MRCIQKSRPRNESGPSGLGLSLPAVADASALDLAGLSVTNGGGRLVDGDDLVLLRVATGTIRGAQGEGFSLHHDGNLAVIGGSNATDETAVQPPATAHGFANHVADEGSTQVETLDLTLGENASRDLLGHRFPSGGRCTCKDKHGGESDEGGIQSRILHVKYLLVCTYNNI